MSDTVADAIRIFLREEGIVVDFGRGHEQDDDSVVIEPLDRVLISPAAFRRLGMALQEALRRQGQLPAPAGPAPRPAQRRSSTPETSVGPPKIPGSTAAASVPRPGVVTTAPPGGGEAPAAPARRKPPVIEEYSRGPARKPDPPPLETLLDPTRHMESSRAEPDAAAAAGTRLFELISGLGLHFVHERSFRIRQGSLLPNRYLMSVGRGSERGHPDETLAGALGRLDMPGDFLERALADLPRARCVHFGFEQEEERHLLKVYLEVAESAEGKEPGEPVLEHIAFKWNPEAPEHRVVGRYLHYPALSAAAIAERVAAIYEASDDTEGSDESLQIAEGVLSLAAQRMPEEDIHYLEVDEKENARRSYSINFYDAGLELRDLYPLLSQMRRRFEIAPGRFQTLYDQIKTARFGHLAGGVHRNGRDFFNVYYGPQAFDPDSGTWRHAVTRHLDG